MFIRTADDLAQSRKSYEECAGVSKTDRGRQTVGESQVQLARLAVEEGRAAEAENILRQWKEQFHLEQQADDELLSSIGLSEALLAQGKQAEAQREIEGSRDLAAKCQNLLGPSAVRRGFRACSAFVGSSGKCKGAVGSGVEEMLARMVLWELNLTPCWLQLIWKSDRGMRLSRGSNWLRWSARLGRRGLCWSPVRRRLRGVERRCRVDRRKASSRAEYTRLRSDCETAGHKN